MSRQSVENRAFIIVLGLITLAFLTILQPFWSSIFWACVMALLFYPLQGKLRHRLNGKNSLSALLTLLAGIILVVIPVTIIAFAFVAEGAQLYDLIESQQIEPAQFFERIGSAVPIIPDVLDRLGIDMSNVRSYLSDSAITLSRLLSQEALSFGRNTVSFTVGLALMLYLTFFLLRDGDKMMGWLGAAVPLEDDRRQLLFRKFTEVVRATVKGNLVVAMVQGALGGFIFWALGITAPVLWAVVMAFLSLVPAVGAALVWVPVAIYLFATGNVMQGSILVAYGAIIIGLADNVLRPILVGRDTKLPDYIVLFSTLGGISLLGINGFVIGPLIAALFISFWSTFSQDFNR
ncbi:AI-2E family transporter [Pseudohongiella sp.]|uniref:AI-2E family transporter n=1 Tax=marine sediment metagenome TaxID=412755 RepID=A0A0F9XIY4_9ZZZZ|nr:AI-2E family transporter [Pseudohongiella sp.]HDZ08822.1 AI-2E family transporter [Pseudohongiella sp.]HEA62438.1 AI-2E family transporter [Pseudohongiella sp.]